MLKLASIPRDPFWLDLLPGARVQVRPVSVAAMLLARTVAGEVLKAADKADGAVRAGEAFTRSLLRSGVVAWEDVGNAASNPVELTPGRIDQLRDHWPAFDAIDRLCVGPALVQDMKKRLIALAEWHFGGGEGYCAACPSRCESCPHEEHVPRTAEGVVACWGHPCRQGRPRGRRPSWR